MKRNFTYITASIIISILLFLGTELAFGQGRYNRGSREYSGQTRSDYPTRRARTDNSKNTYQAVNHENTWNERKAYLGNKLNSYGKHKKGNAYTYKYNNGNAYGHYKHGHSHGYGHQKKVIVHQYHYPQTYNVWHYPAPWKHSRNAVVFRHNHGDYFYHQGRFYRYHPRRGYYVVNIPRTVVFTYLPVGYQEVMIDGYIYYRYGDVVFEWTPSGYQIVRPQRSLYITAHF